MICDIVHGLLRGQGHSRSLRVEAHQSGALVLSAETIFHDPRPDLAGGAVFGDLLKEVVVRVEEEAQPRPELVDIEAPAPRPFHIFNAVV